MRVRVIGAGAAGLTAAFELVRQAEALRRDIAVEIVEKAERPGARLFALRRRHDRALVRGRIHRADRRHAGRGGAEILDRNLSGGGTARQPRRRAETGPAGPAAFFPAHNPFRHPRPRGNRGARARSGRKFRPRPLVRGGGPSRARATPWRNWPNIWRQNPMSRISYGVDAKTLPPTADWTLDCRGLPPSRTFPGCAASRAR